MQSNSLLNKLVHEIEEDTSPNEAQYFHRETANLCDTIMWNIVCHFSGNCVFAT